MFEFSSHYTPLGISLPFKVDGFLVSLEDLYDSELGREMLRHKIVMLLQFLLCNFYER